jgi:hypothetical protein
MNVQEMEAAAFGQLAEHVFSGRGGYDDEVRQQVTARTFEEGRVVGRTVIIHAYHDGEVGPQVAMTPRDMTEPHPTVSREVVDPIAFGV